MKFNTIIPSNLKLSYNQEIELYKNELNSGNLNSAWYHLERSHIIGQSYPMQHTYVHWLMLKFGFRQKDSREIFGQIIRLLFGGWKSFINQIPIGNTGGSNVPPLQKIKLPNDLKLILKKNK